MFFSSLPTYFWILVAAIIYISIDPVCYFLNFKRDQFRGAQCNICHETYQGIALDCKCTNYGQTKSYGKALNSKR